MLNWKWKWWITCWLFISTSKTAKFTSSIKFTKSQEFSNTKDFSSSTKFSYSNLFSKSNEFSQSIEFTSSIQPTPFGEDCLVENEEGNHTIHPCYVTNSQDKTVNVIVLLSNFTDIIEKNSGASISIINGGFNCINATFNHCVSTEGGGGVFIKNSIDLSNEILFKNLFFTKCQALYGGAVYIYFSLENKNINITSCKSSYNTALRQHSASNNELFGGSHLFVTARNINITKSIFKKGTGKGSSVKIYLVFDDDSNYITLDENNNLISISECDFDLEKNDRSSISFIDVKDLAKMTVIDCNFVGKLSQNTHYIDAKVRSNVNNVKIESCQFEYQNEYQNDLLVKTEKKHNLPKIIIVLSVSLFTISFIFITLKLSKFQNENKN